MRGREGEEWVGGGEHVCGRRGERDSKEKSNRHAAGGQRERETAKDGQKDMEKFPHTEEQPRFQLKSSHPRHTTRHPATG